MKNTKIKDDDFELFKTRMSSPLTGEAHFFV
jgi:hypothetical protein